MTPANDAAQDLIEDIDMEDLKDALSDDDGASKENGEQNVDNVPKLSRYGRPIVSILANEIKENEGLVRDAIYAEGDDGNDSSESDNEEDEDV